MGYAPHIHKQKKGSQVWTEAKRRKLLGMCGYFTKEEMALELGVKVQQVLDMVGRMGASYRVTKNKEDYKP